MTKITDGSDGGANEISDDTLSAFGNGDVLSHGATHATFQLADGLTGTIYGDFTAFDANGTPTAGTVTGFREVQSGTTVTTWTEFSLSVSQFFSYVANGDAAGFEQALFSGNDTFVSHDTSTDPSQGDVFVGMGGNDVFDMRDRVTGAVSDLLGGTGNDLFRFGATYNPATDTVDGNGDNGGSDTLELHGDYSTGLVLGPSSHFNTSSFTDIDTIKLDGGFNYKITMGDYVLPEFAPMKVAAYAMGTNDALTFDASAMTSGAVIVDAGAGNDTITGSQRADTINLSKGGADVAHGGTGNDVFVFGTAAGTGDAIDGGAGNDTVVISGVYAVPVEFDATALQSVEQIVFRAGNSYDFIVNTTQSALEVNGRALGAGDVLIADASSETSGNFTLVGGAGNDVLTGGGGDDVIDIRAGGSDTASGSGGNDRFIVGAQLSAGDVIDGGAGADTVLFDANFSGTLPSAALHSVETFAFTTNHNYNITLSSAAVSGTGTLEVNAGAMMFGSVTVDGSAATGTTFRFDVGGVQGHFTGGAGNDAFNFHQSFNGSVDGGAGNDTLIITGNASDTVDFTTSNFKSIETVVLEHSEGYQLTFGAGTVATGQTLTIDGSHLTQADINTIDASAVVGASFAIDDPVNSARITGSQGDDVITDLGTGSLLNGADGNDTLTGGANTSFNFTTGFDGNDRLTGGAGSKLLLDGDYSAGVQLQDDTLSGINQIILQGDFDYKITMADGNVAAGQTLTIGYQNVGPNVTQGLNFDGSAETNGAFVIDGSYQSDVIVGGAGNDTFAGAYNFTSGTFDTVSLGAGDDLFNYSDVFQVIDRIDGGSGTDTLALRSDSNDGYRSGLAFNAHTMVNVEDITLANSGAFGFTITTSDANVAAGATLTVDGHALTAGAKLVFNGAAETDGHFTITGGADADTLTGGALSDTIDGGAGANTIRGGGGGDFITTSGKADTLVYGGAADSTSTGFDTVTDFNRAHDVFDLPTTVTAISTHIASGALSEATFDTDLAAAVNAAHLAASNAVIFAPTAGDFSGKVFLVVDMNGTAGYQAGQDLVIELVNPSSTALTTANFT